MPPPPPLAPTTTWPSVIDPQLLVSLQNQVSPPLLPFDVPPVDLATAAPPDPTLNP
jgi:hypothetical protein